jgi:pyruvate formate-lyase activating enzyme-like uncharacterized protein
MIVDIDRDTLPAIRNAAFRAYAARYVAIYEQFMDQVRASGIEIDSHDYTAEVTERVERLRRAGARFRNDGKSVVANTLSPACVACQQGLGSATFYISLQCHRSCFYCFNPNQEDYRQFSSQQRNLPAELDAIHQQGQQVRHLALTGGEPLLHPAEALEFFRHARQRFPQAHTRLYTTGDQLTVELAQALRDAGLDEIRFSLRMHEPERARRHTFERIALARPLIPSVMVEMPVLPGTFDAMKAVLVELDGLGVDSINLLELCYPFNQAAAFNQRGYKVKARPYRVLYNYWYGGGLPVAGSELECLDLVLFALESGLRMGVHYCSVENKHTGQIYQQNARQRLAPAYSFSERDYFWKTAKVFGPDIRKARKALRAGRHAPLPPNDGQSYLELPLHELGALRGLDLEVGLSFNVLEPRADGQYLRELKLALVRPESFDPGAEA